MTMSKGEWIIQIAKIVLAIAGLIMLGMLIHKL